MFKSAGKVETLDGRIKSTIECLSGVLITAVVKPKCLSRYFCVYEKLRGGNQYRVPKKNGLKMWNHVPLYR